LRKSRASQINVPRPSRSSRQRSETHYRRFVPPNHFSSRPPQLVNQPNSYIRANSGSFRQGRRHFFWFNSVRPIWYPHVGGNYRLKRSWTVRSQSFSVL